MPAEIPDPLDVYPNKSARLAQKDPISRGETYDEATPSGGA